MRALKIIVVCVVGTSAFFGALILAACVDIWHGLLKGFEA
jgi:hypothetical protein